MPCMRTTMQDQSVRTSAQQDDFSSKSPFRALSGGDELLLCFGCVTSWNVASKRERSSSVMDSLVMTNPNFAELYWLGIYSDSKRYLKDILYLAAKCCIILCRRGFRATSPNFEAPLPEMAFVNVPNDDGVEEYLKDSIVEDERER
uniref:Uncharacterized protein n=1 Tax=Romanomermis culicivorax TaxID=13658 RepID=A0A915IRK0_ROMCU